MESNEHSFPKCGGRQANKMPMNITNSNNNSLISIDSLTSTLQGCNVQESDEYRIGKKGIFDQFVVDEIFYIELVFQVMLVESLIHNALLQ